MPELSDAEKQRRKRQKAAKKGVHTRRINKMRKELREIFEVLPDGKRFLAYNMIDNFVWLAVSVQEMRETLDNQAFIVQYDNGGGQKGFKENPNLAVYHKLQGRYSDAYIKLVNTLPDEAIAEKDALEQFLEM